MNSKPLWKISVATTQEAEDAATQLLESLSGQSAISWTDLDAGRTTITAYLSRKPQWPVLRRALRAGMDRIRKCGLRIGTGRVVLQRIRRQDWAESWKRHFPPIEIGAVLLVKPGWSRRRARKGQAVVVLDPGLSFGTGQHPTTAFCLQQLAARRNRKLSHSFLDIGTGSGILAIAAAKLGFTPVHAFDSDPEAIRVARANAHRNRVCDKLCLRRLDLTRQPHAAARKYDLICANLISTLLLSERRRILSRLKAPGVLVLAGILTAEFNRVRKAYANAGLKMIASRTRGEWRSGAFCRRKTGGRR